MPFQKDPRLAQNPLGFWEISPKPSPKDLEEHYAKKYYQDSKGHYEIEYSVDELTYFRAKLSQNWQAIQDIRGHSAPGRLLDVGCGEGFTLAYFMSLGWTVKGIDFSAFGIQSQNPECLPFLQTGDIFALLKDELSRGEKYEVVWLQNVLEHVLYPVELLKSLRNVIQPSGVLVVNVPNDFSILQEKALDANYIDEMFWISPPEHLSYFNYPSLLNTVRATGWDCKEIVADFPIDWFLFHSHANYIKDKSVGKAAHKARVELECLINAQSTKRANNFYSALAQLGLGRSLIAFLQIEEPVS